MRSSIRVGGWTVLSLCAAASSAFAKAPIKPKSANPPTTPVHLDLPCPALPGSVGLDVEVKGEQAVLRVTYPAPLETYKGRGEDVSETRVYFDSDNDARSGLEEWDAESLKLKGVDYSVEVEQAKVFKHVGGLASASGSFTSEYATNVATHTVDLVELNAKRGSVVKALFMVGKCGPVAQTFRLGTATRASARTAGPKQATVVAAATPLHHELPCPALEGSLSLDVDVKGEAAVLRVVYPRPFESYRGKNRGSIDTFVYFDSDNNVRSGLEEWDDESLKIKGADYSVAIREHPSPGHPDAVGGFVLSPRVFTHEGTMANATGSFQSQYEGNVATFTVDLAELHAARGSVVKAMFVVGACGPATETIRLGARPAGARR